MRIAGQINDFEDPLYSTMKKNRKPAAKPAVEEPQDAVFAPPGEASAHGSRARLLILVLILNGAFIIGYYLYQANSQISRLSSDLQTSQAHLTNVSQQLEQSQEKINSLEQGLTETSIQAGQQKRQLGAQAHQYKTMYEELRTTQEQQASVTQQKADREEVNELRTEAGEIKKEVSQANSSISDLRDVSARNSNEIEASKASIATLNQSSADNQRQISEVKHSLAKETYGFELYEKGGVMKVFNVALSLKDVDFNRQRYDMEILTNGKKIKKDDQHLNEPIVFYIEGVSKPYEVVVTKVDKKYVVGHLSVPKS